MDIDEFTTFIVDFPTGSIHGWQLPWRLLFSCSVMASSATSRTAACQASLSFTLSQTHIPSFFLTNETFSLIIFILLVVVFSFSFREDHITFLIRLSLCCWTPSFSCKTLAFSFKYSLPSGVLLVIRFFFLSSLEIYHATPFWLANFLLKSLLVAARSPKHNFLLFFYWF